MPSRDHTVARLGELRGRYPIQHAVRPMVIIVHPPAIHNISRLGQVQEQLAVETFITQLAIERFNVSVLPRAARFDE